MKNTTILNTIIILLLCCFLPSCATIPQSKREYISFIEVKADLGLSYKETKALLSNDSIATMYHAGRDQKLYKIEDVKKHIK